MKGPSPILLQDRSQSIRVLEVQRAHVAKEENGQVADLPSRQSNAVGPENLVADLLSLPMMQKALGPHEDHNIITDGTACTDMPCQRNGSSRHQGVIGIATSGRTDMHGFSYIK